MVMVAPTLPNPDGERATLQAIVSLMSDLKSYTSHTLGTQQPSVRNDTSYIDIPELDLPFPHDILAPIFKIPIPEEVRRQILQAIQNRIQELQQRYLDAYRRACIASVQKTVLIDDLTIVRDAYLALYLRNSTPMVERIVSFILHEIEKYQQPRVVEAKPSFKIEYTPVLEKYFETNAYPSNAHRISLAQKSEMTPRQIEVWFQNHRNRAKKEGKPVPRIDTDFPLQQALRFLHQAIQDPHIRLPTPPIDESKRDRAVQKAEAKSEQHPVLHSTPSQKSNLRPPTLLDDSYNSRQPHTFPATKNSQYPDPFPNVDGVFKFPPPVWRRKPTTIPNVLCEVDMDDFAQIFHLKLSFAENSKRRGTSPSKNEFFARPWFGATTTFPPSAPHPALIRKASVSQTASRNTPYLQTAPFNPKFGSSSLSVLHARKLTPPGEGASARKIRPLPRRVPHSRTSSFGSRTSSFSSDSSISNYSSPELSTPPPLPNLDLPVFHNDGQQEPFYFSQTELDTHYPLPDFLPSADLSLTNEYPISNKHSEISFFSHAFPDFGHNLGEILF